MSDPATRGLIRALVESGLATFAGVMIGASCAHSPQANLAGRVVDERGNGVAGAQVGLSGRPEKATTGLDGRFHFALLPAGTYVLGVSARNQNVRFQDSTQVRRNRLTEVELTIPDVSALGHEFKIPTGTIEGTVVDENGIPLQGAFVIVVSARQAGESDTGGHFVIQGVPIGVHTIQVRRFDFAPLDRDDVWVVVGPPTNVMFRLSPQAIRSTETRTGSILARIVSEKDEALAYASVFVLGAQTGGQSDIRGRALIQKIPIGVYTVRVKMVGFAQMERMAVRVSEGDTTTVDFKLRPQPVKIVPLEQSYDPK